MSIEVGHSVRYNKLFDIDDTNVTGKVVYKRNDDVVVLFEKEGEPPWLELARDFELEIM